MPIDPSRPFVPLQIAILKVDDTPSRADAAGDLLIARLLDAGHGLAHRSRERQDAELILQRFRSWVADPGVDCVISAGGTGLTDHDVVPETMALLDGRDIPGFGELFRSISFASVGTSSLQSRACAVVVGDTCLFAVPGSPGGAADAWDGILSTQLDSRHRPCSLVDLMPSAGSRALQGPSAAGTQKESILGS